MDLLEQFNYLIDSGIIKVEEQNSKNLFEYNNYRKFVKELEALTDKDNDISELEKCIEELEDKTEDLNDRLACVLDELANYKKR